MLGEISSIEFFITNLALDHHLRALSLDVLEELLSIHMLVVLVVADITTEFGAVEHGVLLQLPHGLPNNDTFIVSSVAFMWEFTEVNTVSQYLIDLLQEVTSGLAVGTARVESCVASILLLSRVLLSGLLAIGVSFPLPWGHLIELLLV